MTSRMFRWVGIAIPVVALTCGSWAFAQQAPKKQEPKPAEAKKPEAKPQEKKEDGKKDILAAAAEAKLNTFVDLVKLAGLTDELKKPGPFTVFAPTDEAFKAIKDLDDLKKPENKEKLAALLKGHVVAKKVDPAKDKDAKPLAGADIKLADKAGKVMVNEKINVTKNVDASNGTIHVIDAVIQQGAAKPAEKPEMKPAPKPEPKPEPKKG